MTKPIDAGGRTQIATFTDDEVQPLTVQKPKSAQASAASTSTETWQGMPERTSREVSTGPSYQPGELAAQVAQHAADRNQAKGTVMQLGAALRGLAERHPDPMGRIGRGDLSPGGLGAGAFGQTAISDDFLTAAGRLSPREVAELLKGQVCQAWPHLSPEDVEELTAHLNGQVKEALRDQAAFRMQHAAGQMMGEAATAFESCARDPERLAQLANTLTELGAPGSSPEARQRAGALREALGVEGDGTLVQPDHLARGMTARAALMKREGHTMAERGVPSLFRTLAHHDLENVLKQQLGAQPGSLLDAQIAAVKARGEAEEATIAQVKLFGSAAVVVATGGLGLGLIPGLAVGMGTSAALSAPSVAQAWRFVDEARAGESAGTLGAGARAEASRDAAVATGAAAFEVLAGGALHGVVHEPLAQGAAHLALGFGTLQAEHALSDALGHAEEPSGENALRRAGAK